MAKELVDIGNHLRLVAFGIECVLGARLQLREVERAVADAAEDQVSVKEYVFPGLGDWVGSEQFAVKWSPAPSNRLTGASDLWHR